MGAWIAVLLAWPAGAALPAPPVELPGWLSQGLAAVDRSMAGVEAGRRLAAASAGLGLEARRIEPEEPALVYRGGERPAIVVDPKRAEGFKELELELAVVRARATARYDVGLSLVEVEQAVEQAVLEYALERALASEAFGAPLKRAVSRSRRSEDVRREAGGAPIPLPLREPERVGELLRRFGDDAEEFYWTIEREAARRGSAVRLAELETFLWSYSERLDRAVCPPPGRYCKLEGRLLDAALVPAARAALAGGGLERVRETLGGFQAEPAQALRKRLAAWVGR